MNRLIDLAGQGVMLVFSVGLLIAALRFPPPPEAVQFDAIGPMGLPTALSVLLILLLLLQLTRSLKAVRDSGSVWAERHEGTPDEPGYGSSVWRSLGIMLGSLLLAFGLSFLGFLVAGFIGVVAGLSAMHYRGWPARIIVGIVFSVMGFVVFQMILSINLPTGLLGDLLMRLNLVDFAY